MVSKSGYHTEVIADVVRRKLEDKCAPGGVSSRRFVQDAGGAEEDAS